MTVRAILESIKPIKPITRQTLYRHLRRLKIQPSGIRQRPQHYPDDTARRILAKLGHNGHDAILAARKHQ